MLAWRKICCPIDFSDTSREAMHVAVDLAAKLGAKLTLLHVYQVPSLALPEGVVIATPEMLNDLAGQVEKLLESWRAEAAGRPEAKNLEIGVATALGTPFAEIARHAQAGGFDVIVIGTHGRGAIKRALLGSVAERVVRMAACPVITVGPRAAAAAHAAEKTPGSPPAHA